MYERNIINLKFPGIINHWTCWEFCIGQAIKHKHTFLRHERVAPSLTHDDFPMWKTQLATGTKHFSRNPIIPFKWNLICLEFFFFSWGTAIQLLQDYHEINNLCEIFWWDVRFCHGRESTLCRVSSDLCVHTDGSSLSGFCWPSQLSLTLGTLTFRFKVESSTGYSAKCPLPWNGLSIYFSLTCIICCLFLCTC